MSNLCHLSILTNRLELYTNTFFLFILIRQNKTFIHESRNGRYRRLHDMRFSGKFKTIDDMYVYEPNLYVCRILSWRVVVYRYI